MKPRHGTNIFIPDNKDKIYELIKTMVEIDGLTYGEVATALAKQGWVGRHNNQLTQPIISRFMIGRGYRLKAEHSKKRVGSKSILQMLDGSQVSADMDAAIQQRLDLAVQILDSEIDMAKKIALVKQTLRLR